jgi:hypothetical protein
VSSVEISDRSTAGEHEGDDGLVDLALDVGRLHEPSSSWAGSFLGVVEVLFVAIASVAAWAPAKAVNVATRPMMTALAVTAGTSRPPG